MTFRIELHANWKTATCIAEAFSRAHFVFVFHFSHQGDKIRIEIAIAHWQKCTGNFVLCLHMAGIMEFQFILQY